MKNLNRKQRIRWEMLLSHHAECDYDRTCLIFGIRVCSRCMGILAGSFFGAFFAKYFINISYLQNCACFAGLMLPAGIDFTVHELVTKYKSSNLIRFISGFIFGIALGNSFVLTFLYERSWLFPIFLLLCILMQIFIAFLFLRLNHVDDYLKKYEDAIYIKE